MDRCCRKSHPWLEKNAAQNDGITAKHTTIVLACCMNLPEYQMADVQKRCEIEWTAIFHDLDKNIQYGRGDGSHGVRSAGVAAQCLANLGFSLYSDGDFVAWVDLGKSSQKQVAGKWVNDFSHLTDITSGLRYFFNIKQTLKKYGNHFSGSFRFAYKTAN